MGAATPRARIVNLVLAVLLLWSGALRVWLATEGLSANHYWDERYNVKNLRGILVGGELEPISYYYPALSYLPQAALLAGSQRIARFVDPTFAWFEDRDLRPAGYLICRLVQVVYGLGSILLTFAIGRRLFSPAVGLLGALFLAVSPVHVRLSAFFKPDIQLAFLVLVALLLALRAAADPSWRRYALAGAGVGLAMSSKLNGGPIALPIALVALVGGRRQPSHFLKLAAAGAVSVVTFLLLNPHLDRYLAALSRNQDIYAHRDHTTGVLPRTAEVLRDTGAILLSPTFHGIGVAMLAAAGAVLLMILVVRHRSEPERALPWLMLLAFPLGYVVIYAVATGYAKPNNFLPILPMSSLLAALFVVRAWTWAETRAAALRGPVPRALAAALLTLVVAYPTQAWVYDIRTRTTWEVAFDQVAAALKPWEGRVAHFEEVPPGMIWRPRALRVMVRQTPSFDAIAPEDLDQLDAAVFAASGANANAAVLSAEHRRDVGGVELREIRPRFFRTRGPRLEIAVRAPRLLSTRQIALSNGPGSPWALPLDAPATTGELVSVSFWLPPAVAPPRLHHGELAVDLASTRVGKSVYYLSRRVRRCLDDRGADVLSLELAAPAPRGNLDLTLYRWAADCGSDGSRRR